MFETLWHRRPRSRRRYFLSKTGADLLLPSHVTQERGSEQLEVRCLLSAQVLSATPAADTASINTKVSFEMKYSTIDPINAKTTGVAFRMHYNSVELKPDLPAIIASAFPGATIQDKSNTSLDSAATTDRYLNFLWTDIQGQFPASTSLPITLFTATFTTTNFFNGETIKFTATPPIGFTFNASPIQINLDPTTPTLTVDDAAIVDEGTSAVFPVKLSAPAPAGGITVTYSTADDTAKAGSDYTAIVGQTITIAEGQTSGSISIATKTDSIAEGTEVFRLNITSATHIAIADGNAVGTIRNVNTGVQKFDFDIDGNGVRNGFQDGVLLFAWMLGPDISDADFQKLIAANADPSRNTVAKIRAYLDSHQELLDIDSNGVRNGFQDAVLVFAWMLGPDISDANFQKLIPANADPSRNTVAKVKGYLDGLQSVLLSTADSSTPLFLITDADGTPGLFDISQEPVLLPMFVKDDETDIVFAETTEEPSVIQRLLGLDL